MTPQNFQNFWEILNPLKKEKYRPNSKNYNDAETIEKRNSLLIWKKFTIQLIEFK
jgi:hypothetical protein